MEHEVFVPVPAESVRRVLTDPARVARCVPGLQLDADDTKGPLAGRLKVRVDGHTITYRGALHLAERDGGFTITGEGAEARGPGSVTLALELRLTGTDAGTTLTFTGTAGGEGGRLTELSPEAALAAAGRLLDRFGDRVGAEVGADAPADSGADADSEADSEADSGAGSRAGSEGDVTPSVFDAEVPPPSLDPVSEAEFIPAGEPPQEAAHARRTMIGRSAEEVDHAPPRGRYAPVPAPSSVKAGATLRWAAPAAALALASAVVVGRALRRRR
ncbi:MULTISPECIES: SRPBCC family protein [unclassified Streptomyces]|uniref:SRPBCC family protein n=1 Tax=unclassified Streptomyces TaxID=2593676 RepID=UPI002DD8720D|nr:SRPBCC family protein [Streptomyces sp. NBC_01766]WSC21365.1 SRPBCC domain-containing protein [Streptomyces sp. NBC_01766]